jgi:hypothetical protein
VMALEPEGVHLRPRQLCDDVVGWLGLQTSSQKACGRV